MKNKKQQDTYRRRASSSVKKSQPKSNKNSRIWSGTLKPSLSKATNF